MVHQRQRRVVDAGEHHPAHACLLGGGDQAGPEFDRVGGKRRDDQEHAVDPVQSCLHAVRITKIAHNHLDISVLELARLGGIVQQRPYLYTTAHQRRYHQPSELARRTNRQNLHVTPPRPSLSG